VLLANVTLGAVTAAVFSTQCSSLSVSVPHSVPQCATQCPTVCHTVSHSVPHSACLPAHLSRELKLPGLHQVSGQHMQEQSQSASNTHIADMPCDKL
jgi:hypothetical protein